MTNEQKLEAYAKEIGTSLDVESLIASHRRLREEARQHNSEFRAFRERARKAGYDYGLSQVTDNHISIEALRGMTLAELVERLAP